MDTPVANDPVNHQPRANRIVDAGEIPGLRSAIWMGGADSNFGEPVTAEMLASAWVLDCAGRMPGQWRESSERWAEQVFGDTDSTSQDLDALIARVQEWSEELLRAGSDAPDHVFVMCQFGMNRSGLATGFLLRGLGLSTDDAVRRITTRRPGALSNTRFRRAIALVDIEKH